MKKLIVIMLLCILCLVSCNGKHEETAYKTDVSVDTLAEKIYSVVGNNDLTEADEGWVALNIPVDTSLGDESAVYINATGSADLFGIIKASSEDNAEKLLEQSEEYLDTLEANWMSEYLAEELPKIENAKAVKCGLYVAFIIVDEAIVDDAVTQFENTLKAD